MRNKLLNIVIIILALFIGAMAFFVSNYCGKFRFTETTGFYFSGLNSTEIGSVKAYGLNKNHDTICGLYCFEQYRTTDDYIYKNWRHDFRFAYTIDDIIINIPPDLAKKINCVWFKTGTQVTKVSGEEFNKLWVENKSNSATTYRVPYDISGNTGFFKGLKCFWHSQQSVIRNIRYAEYFLVVVLLILTLKRLKNKIVGVLKSLFLNTKNFFIKHKKLFKPVIVFFMGLIFAFILLEITLHIIGYFHNRANIETQYKTAFQIGNTIICAGDSFTESFGSSENNDYPSQLEHIINQNFKTNYSIYNFGRSGKNTAQIAIEFPTYIKKYQPQLIIILAGSANYWNYWGYRDEGFWSSLKTVKLFKLLINNIRFENKKNVFQKEEYVQLRNQFKLNLITDTSDLTPIINVLRSQNVDSINAYIEFCLNNKSLSDNDIYHIIMYSMLSEKTEIALNYLDRFKPISERGNFYKELLIELLMIKKLDLRKYSSKYKAYYHYIKQMLKSNFNEEELRLCIEYDSYFEDAYYELSNLNINKIKTPENFSEKRYSFADSLCYYRSIYKLRVNNHLYSDVNIKEDLEGSINNREIDKWVAKDIISMIEICKNNGVKVVLMNYPILHKSTLFYPVNKVLRKTATKYEIPFVDNEYIFDTIRQNRNSYFISDGHCSDKGYNLMAKNIYNILKGNKLLEQKATYAE